MDGCRNGMGCQDEGENRYKHPYSNVQWGNVKIDGQTKNTIAKSKWGGYICKIF